ncbi:DUF6461 domain-containing protein [Nonomuraea maritima]|uniref:DUF6461 domain-containing protein n=1 Tax=Nonomuraea maritima TaxID=683260 RepID=UPI00371D6F78
MIRKPDKYAWLTEAADGSTFTYVHGLTPEQVVTRLGGRPEDFTPETLDALGNADGRGPGAFLGVTTIGDWAFVVEPYWHTIAEEMIMPLSAGTRLVSHHSLGIKGLDHFFWVDDRQLRFCFIAQEGYAEEVPDELVETMDQIDSLYPPLADPSDGPMFLLTEHLTGITLTPQLLNESSYMWGTVPEPRSWMFPTPW